VTNERNPWRLARAQQGVSGHGQLRALGFWPWAIEHRLPQRPTVETDGLRYHRTPARQARDRLRDQAHVAAGLTQLRFTHAQIAFDRGHVKATLAAVAARRHRNLVR
jgi:hypothetical protein